MEFAHSIASFICFSVYSFNGSISESLDTKLQPLNICLISVKHFAVPPPLLQAKAAIFLFDMPLCSVKNVLNGGAKVPAQIGEPNIISS